jgi:DME family drug/metabolite transporter
LCGNLCTMLSNNIFSGVSPRRLGLVSIIAGAILWSTGGLFIKLLPFNALTILFYRSAFAALLFAVLFRRSIFKVNLLTIFISVMYAGLLWSFVTSTKLTTAANAIFLQYTAPIYVLLLEPVLFKTSLRKIDMLTIVLSLIGMVLFFSGDLEIGDMRGNWIALFSGVLLAGILLGQRFNSPERYETAIFWGNILVVFIGFPAWLEAPAPSTADWGMLIFLGFIQIGMGYILFNYGLKRVLAVESALLAMLEPILNPVWVFIGYGERPGSMAIVGGGIIVAVLAIRVLVTERRASGISSG